MNGNSNGRSGGHKPFKGQEPKPYNRSADGRKPGNRAHDGRKFDERRVHDGHSRDERKFEGSRGQGDRARDGRKFDNRPHDGERKFGGERKHGERPRGERRFDDRPRGERKFGGERKFDNRPHDSERKHDDRPHDGERRFDGRPHDGERKFDGDRKFDNRPHSERRFDDRPRGDWKLDSDRKYGESPRGDWKFDGDRKHSESPRSERRFDGRPHGGDRKFDGEPPHGERRFDDRPRSERKFDGDRKFDNRPHDSERKHDDRPHDGDRRFDGRPHGERRYDDRPRGERRFDGRPEGGRFRPFAAPVRGGGRSPLPHPETARDAALLALDDVIRHDAYASQALDRALSAVRLSPEDRRLAASIFYFAVENRLRIEWTLGKLMETRPEPVVSDVLHIAAAQLLFMDRIPDHAAVDEAVKQVRAAGRGGLDKLVNGVLRSLIRARDAGEPALPDRAESAEEFLSVRYSLALPAVRRLVAAYGVERTEALLAHSPETREITVRPNHARIGRADFEALLDEAHLSWRRGGVDDAYILSDAAGLADLPAYRAGLFSIQSEGSMLAALAVGARPGMRILDACAAPGGKTCLMAERMGASGRVFAWDVHAHRVELIRAAARRLGLDNVRPSVRDARRTDPDMALSMDAVLVDAPCSGLGVMWNKPDIRFRATEESLSQVIPLQREILDACAEMVRPGGLLVYSTCTILPEENEAQARAFLERHPEFEPDGDAGWLPEALRGHFADGRIQLMPDRDGIEGFFIARMRRRRT